MWLFNAGVSARSRHSQWPSDGKHYSRCFFRRVGCGPPVRLERRLLPPFPTARCVSELHAAPPQVFLFNPFARWYSMRGRSRATRPKACPEHQRPALSQPRAASWETVTFPRSRAESPAQTAGGRRHLPLPSARPYANGQAPPSVATGITFAPAATIRGPIGHGNVAACQSGNEHRSHGFLHASDRYAYRNGLWVLKCP